MKDIGCLTLLLMVGSTLAIPRPASAQTDSVRVDADRSYTDSAGISVRPFLEITCKPNTDYHRLTVEFYTGLLAVGAPVVIKVGDLESSELTFMTLEDRKTIMFLDQLPNNEISRLSSAQLVGLFGIKGTVVLAFQPFLEKDGVGVQFDTSKLIDTLRDSHPACFAMLAAAIPKPPADPQVFPLQLEISSECESLAFIRYRVDDGPEQSGEFSPGYGRNTVELPLALAAKGKIVISTDSGYTVAHLIFRLNGQQVKPEWRTADKGKAIRLNSRRGDVEPCSAPVPSDKAAEVVFQALQTK
ncbi:MAG TPA: hypothetical protein VG714_07175 [Acidobacteriaceae bacterium]|nr:hypothetical protein [Acidobacteriaceae bacterium]